MTWTDLLSCDMTDAYKITDNLMAMVKDSDLSWKPTTGKNWMTTGQLLKHLTDACGMCCKGFVTGDWGMPEGVDASELPPDQKLPPAAALPTVSSVAEARKALAADREVAFAMVAQAGEDALDGQISAAPWNPEHPQCLGQHLLDMVGHLNQHKGQLFYYLKLMDRDVNTMHLWGV